MIPKITKGKGLRKLLEYLYGPGRANEHTEQHLVAGYDDPAILEPQRRADGRPELAELTAKLAAPHVAAGDRGRDEWVWHCSLSLKAEEGQLSDDRWQEIGDEFVERMGFGATSNRPGCRWVGVRHGLSANGNDHIHLVVTLAREDGSGVDIGGDFPRAQQVCRQLEAEYGLRTDVIGDGRSRRNAPGRAEIERADREGAATTDREWLRQQVRAAAAAATSEWEWVANMRAAGLIVAVRAAKDDPTRCVGYAVARPSDDGRHIWFGGRKLDGELSLPRVRERWPTTALTVQEWRGVEASPSVTIEDEAQRIVQWRAAAESIEAAAAHFPSLPPHSPDTELAVRAAGDVMAQVAAMAEQRSDGPVTKAADAMSRATVPARRPPRHEPSSQGREIAASLGQVALLIAVLGRSRGVREAAAVVAVVVAVARLAMALDELRQAAGRGGSSSAARAAGNHLVPVLTAANQAGVRLQEPPPPPRGTTDRAATRPRTNDRVAAKDVDRDR